MSNLLADNLIYKWIGTESMGADDKDKEKEKIELGFFSQRYKIKRGFPFVCERCYRGRG